MKRRKRSKTEVNQKEKYEDERESNVLKAIEHKQKMEEASARKTIAKSFFSDIKELKEMHSVIDFKGTVKKGKINQISPFEGTEKPSAHNVNFSSGFYPVIDEEMEHKEFEPEEEEFTPQKKKLDFGGFKIESTDKKTPEYPKMSDIFEKYPSLKFDLFSIKKQKQETKNKEPILVIDEEEELENIKPSEFTKLGEMGVGESSAKEMGEITEKEKRVAFRTIEIIYNQNDKEEREKYESEYFEANGRVFKFKAGVI